MKLVSLISESNIIKVLKKTTKSVSLGLGSAKNQTSENAKNGKRKCVVMERRKYFVNDDTMFCFVQFSCFWMTDAGAKLLSFNLIQTNFTKLEVLLSNFTGPILPCENNFTFQVYRKRPTITIVGL